jgi:hypothetical protein
MGFARTSVIRVGILVTLNLYAAGPGSALGPNTQTSRLRFFQVFLSPSRKILGYYSKAQPLPSSSYPVHHPSITLSFDTIQSPKLTV